MQRAWRSAGGAGVGFFALLLSLSAAAPLDAPKGFVELTEYRYPVFLYAPKSGTDGGLIMVVSREKSSPDKVAREWTKLADERRMVVVVPGLKPRENDVPYVVDKWFLKLKTDLSRLYRIEASRVFLVGEAEGGHYAAYLGTKYPREFAAVGLMGRAWPGPFEKLTRPSGSKRDQVPFYVMVDKKSPAAGAVVERAAVFTGKGYPVEVVSGIAGEVSKGRLLDWLQDHGESWASTAQSSKKSFREKVSSGFKNLFITN